MKIYAVIIAMFVFWFMGSWGEIASQNSLPDVSPTYSKYNMFVMLTDLQKQ